MAPSARISIRMVLEVQLNDERKGVTIEGDGHGDPFTGSYDLDLTASPAFPPGFAIAGPSYCEMPLRLFFSRPQDGAPSFADLTDLRYRVDPEWRVLISTAAGTQVADLRARSDVCYAKRVLACTQRLWGDYAAAELAAVTRVGVPYDDTLEPLGPGQARGEANCQLLGGSGGPLTCTARVPYRWDGDALPEPLVCTVTEQRVDWDGGPFARVHVRSVLRTATAGLPSPLARAAG